MTGERPPESHPPAHSPAPDQPLPTTGRLAAVDFGTVRIGVAICDADRRLASPLENYTRRSERLDAEFFRKLAELERIVGWVVGLPVHGHGVESVKSREARRFGDWLGRVSGLPVAYFDERFTTAQADEILGQARLTRRQKQERRDKLAAQILLTAYLESPHRAHESLEALDDPPPANPSRQGPPPC